MTTYTWHAVSGSPMLGLMIGCGRVIATKPGHALLAITHGTFNRDPLYMLRIIERNRGMTNMPQDSAHVFGDAITNNMLALTQAYRLKL